MREAPSRYLMDALWAEGASVQAYDPEAMSECRRLYGYRNDLHLCATRDDTLEDADALVICTEWKNFRVVDFEWLASKLRARVVIDGRNLYNPEHLAAAGLHYSGIGLRHIAPEGCAHENPGHRRGRLHWCPLRFAADARRTHSGRSG